MKKEMLINVLQPEECRIAIVEDGVLDAGQLVGGEQTVGIVHVHQHVAGQELSRGIATADIRAIDRLGAGRVAG